MQYTKLDQDRRTEKTNLTIAQCIQRSSNPIQASIASFVDRNVQLHEKTYFFEDGSFIKFNVTYTVSGTGVTK